MTPEQARRLGRSEREGRDDASEEKPGDLYTYENPDGTVIRLLCTNGVVVTVDFTTGVPRPPAA
jgi:hypothetical protein